MKNCEKLAKQYFIRSKWKKKHPTQHILIIFYRFTYSLKKFFPPVPRSFALEWFLLHVVYMFIVCIISIYQPTTLRVKKQLFNYISMRQHRKIYIIVVKWKQHRKVGNFLKIIANHGKDSQLCSLYSLRLHVYVWRILLIRRSFFSFFLLKFDWKFVIFTIYEIFVIYWKLAVFSYSLISVKKYSEYDDFVSV